MESRLREGFEMNGTISSKLNEKPIQLAWSRADEFFYDTFRPAAAVKIKSGFNDSGKMVLWDYGMYELPWFSWVPKIESVLIEADDSPSKGAGEPAIICMGGVLANAVYGATGARLFQIPMTPERIKQALA